MSLDEGRLFKQSYCEHANKRYHRKEHCISCYTNAYVNIIKEDLEFYKLLLEDMGEYSLNNIRADVTSYGEYILTFKYFNDYLCQVISGNKKEGHSDISTFLGGFVIDYKVRSGLYTIRHVNKGDIYIGYEIPIIK